MRDKVTEILAHVEVAIDYPEEDIEHITYQTLKEKTDELKKTLKII